MQAEEISLRMHAVTGIGAVRASRIITELVRAAGDPFRLLRAVGLNEKQCNQFQHCDRRYLTATLDWLEQPGHQLLRYGDDSFPEALQSIDQPPLLLLVEGASDALSLPQVAMVGSRQFSHYGEYWATHFAQGLVQSGFAITSGLAIGIDGICHRAALAAGGITLAVLGCGLNNIYPRRHSELARQIVERGGALISEHLVTDLPLADHFPRRNRIISGLSAGVVVIEASLRSGSLITARCALEQGREVFALPGALGNAMSAGTNWLIQQGANLVTAPAEIVQQLDEGLHWLRLPEEPVLTGVVEQVELPFDDLLANVGDEVLPVDVIAERAGQPVAEVMVRLLELELAGRVVAVPGGYVRVRVASNTPSAIKKDKKKQ
ncbi:DNA-protecting protein DprA [Serratia microhaemolytica]|uniref:DNA-protecting protein DprA n=1 Tax=Serratia microhaemolytica TaxID=2675110 RepID=UPI000FDE617F|nr:DNA-protecting protein DprA [Serratia microhaemolytica]